jgi:orotidine-5'-phosphate decarboxylase
MDMKPKDRLPKDRLVVALDVDTADDALKLVKQLHGLVGMFKIGSQLFTATGKTLVEEIVSNGNRVFLDLKFHDIPHQVSGAVRSVTGLGISMLTIHASGGPEMMRRAVETAKETADKDGIALPFIVAVTVLTSIDSNILAQVGFGESATETVKRLATLAAKSGVDGVVASPQEITTVRSAIPNRKFLIVTPGIRPDSGVVDDQKRVASPGFALGSGADYLVVGRPITGASDAVQAVERIVAEMETSAALKSSSNL